MQTSQSPRVEPEITFWKGFSHARIEAILPLKKYLRDAGHGNVDEYMVIEGDGKVAGLAEVEKYLVDLVYNYAQQAGRTEKNG